MQLEILKMRVDRVETELKIKKNVAATPPAAKTQPVDIAPEMPAWQAVEVPQKQAEETHINTPKSTFEPSSVPLPAVVKPRRPQKSTRDWESIIGGKWALWVGSFSIFLAIASFIAYSWDKLPPAPPWARVLMGIVAGFAMIGGALYSRSRLQKWFSEGLAGGGLAVIYLSLWAASQSFGLLSFNLAFVLMGLITAFGVVLALRFDAISLSVLAMLGGFMTPLLLQDIKIVRRCCTNSARVSFRLERGVLSLPKERNGEILSFAPSRNKTARFLHSKICCHKFFRSK